MKRYIKATVADISDLSKDEIENVLTDYSANPVVLDMFAQYAISKKDFFTISKLLLNSNVPEDTIMSLLEVCTTSHAYSSLSCIPMEFLKRNINNYKIMSYLATNGSSVTQYDISTLSNLPIEILEILSNDTSRNVRSQVANHPNATMDILLKLAKDPDYDVQHTILERKYPTSDMRLTMWRALLDAPDILTHRNSIHTDVASQLDWKMRYDPDFPPIPEDILIKLATDARRTVKDYVIDWIEDMDMPRVIFNILVNDKDQKVRESLAKESVTLKIPEDILIQLADDTSEDVRESIATMAVLPEDSYMQLANDESRYVRVALTHNTYVPNSVIEFLLNDEEPRIREIAEDALRQRGVAE